MYLPNRGINTDIPFLGNRGLVSLVSEGNPKEKQMTKETLPVPRVGDDIYVGTSLYLSHGEDDFCGGLAQVVEVLEGLRGGGTIDFGQLKERPGISFNWEQYLAQRQEELKERFGSDRAHPDPDYRPEFNRWD